MKILIKSVEIIKEGRTNNIDWKLIKVVDSDGTEYTGFDEDLLLAEGQTIEALVEDRKTEKNGRVYVNKNIKIAKCLHCPLHCPKQEANTITLDETTGSTTTHGSIDEEPPF